MLPIIINDVEVSLVAKDGFIFANSLDVANVFEKAHKHVLTKIENFSERGRTNFWLTSYTDKSNRQSLMYEMNRDGFMFLVMGFTGEKAENFKLDFIDGFNALERELKKPLSISEQIVLIAQGHQEVDKRLTHLEETKKLEYWQEKALQDAKNETVYRIASGDDDLAKKLHRKVWSLFKKQFFLPRYNELPAVKFDDGKSYLLNLTFADMV